MSKAWALSLLFLSLLIVAMSPAAQAQTSSKQFTEIEYDEAGRVKAIRTAVETAAPTATTMTPAIVRHGPAVNIEVAGSSLRGATIASDHPGLVVSAVTATASRATFRLQADETVPLGEHRLSFTTALGSSEIAFTVRPRLPVLQIEPNPAALAPGDSLAGSIRVDSADVIPHTFTLSGSGAVSATPSTLTLAAGSTTVGTVTLQASALGVGALRVEADEIADVTVPVFVTPRYQPPAGGASFYSRLVGVQVGEPASPPNLITRGPFTALLGVVMPSQPNTLPTTVSPLVAAPLGVSIGAVAARMQPDYVVRGSGSTTVEVLGAGLGGVNGVTLVPASNVTVTVQSLDASGDRVVLNVSAEAAAALGDREVRLIGAGGVAVPFATRAGANLRIVDPQPEVDSVAPLFLLRGVTTTVTVRGRRLHETTSLRLTPPDSVVVDGAPNISMQGDVLTAVLSVAADAALGERAISLLSAAGETSTAAAANNRVNVVAAATSGVSPIVAPLLGIHVAGGGSTGSQAIFQPSPLLGVVVGGGFSALDPTARSVSSNFVLRVSGQGLAAVNGLSFEPATGITVDSVAAEGDGSQVTANVTIASDAPRGLRRVQLASPSGAVLPTQPGADLFRITEVLPEIDSVSPLVVVPGGASVALSLRGRNFSDATAVRFIPADDTSISAPNIAPDGQSLSASLNISATAALGERIVVIDTPTGSSGTTAAASNTIRFASAVTAEVSPLLAPLLGVQIGSDAGSTQDIGLVSSLMGVTIAFTPPEGSNSYLLPAHALGVAIGPVAKALSPRYLLVGRPATLSIQGVGLSGATAIEFQPPEGITVTGALQVTPDGLSAALPIEVASDASQVERRIVIRAGSNEISFALLDGALARVVGNEPRIDSIGPIQVTPNQTISLTIRGGSLFGASAVTATPSQGLTFGVNPSVSADGSIVTVAVTIAANAPGGPRVIRVVTSGGTTTDEALAANTFTVVTGK